MAILHGMTYDEYEELPGWRWSHIRLLHDGSPLHVQHALTAPDEDTASRRWLRAVHCLTLEPENFQRDFSLFVGVRRGKAFDAHLEDNPGKAVLNLREWDDAHATAKAVRTHREVARLLAHGNPEVVLTWDDKVTGLPCKARLDWLGPKGFVDLKTIGTTHETEVARMVERHLYHGQLAHYASGLRANGIDALAYLIAAEGRGAQDVAVFRLDARPPDGPLHLGEQIRDTLMWQLGECVKADRWPGRHEEVQDLILRESEMPDPDEYLVTSEEAAR